MSKAVLDASALLAVLFNEAGGEKVIAHLPSSLLSAVNLSEVISKAVERGMPFDETMEILAEFPCEVISFDAVQAARTAELRESTRSKGLSLGDRACLALGIGMKLPVVTADRQWTECGLDVEIVQIRS